MKSLLTSLFQLLVVGLFAVSFVSCSGGDEPAGKTKKSGKKSRSADKDSGDESDASSEGGDSELADEVQDLLSQVKKLGADKTFSEEISKIRESIKKAQSQAEDGDAAASDKTYRPLVGRLKRLIADQEKVDSSLKELAGSKSAVEEARKKAEAEKAQENAPVLYKEGASLLKKATDALAKPSLEGLQQARTDLSLARDRFELAATMAKENAAYSAKVTEEKEVMGKWKARAKEADAELKASSDWMRAGQMERDADDCVARGELQSAVDIYRSAAQGYQMAFQQVTDAATMAAAQAELVASAGAGAATPAGGEAEPAATPDSGNPPAAPKYDPVPVPPAPGAGGAVVGGHSSGVSIDVEYNEELCKQTLDDEDEAFLTEHYAQLTPSGLLQYDVTTGAVSIDYGLGTDVKKDILTPGMKAEWTAYKPLGMPRNITPEEQRKYSQYSFEGNTKGSVFFPIPLRCVARVEWGMQVLTMDAVNNFGVFVNYDARKKSGLMTSWLKVGTTKGTKLGPAVTDPAKYTRSADEWFDKKDEVPMVAEFRQMEAKKGEFSLLYNMGGEDEQKSVFAGAPAGGGYVGFYWDRVKFQVRQLRISGILDKQSAVDTLRKKLKMPKGK